MHEVKFVRSAVMFPAISELLDLGQSVRITVTGISMYPFLRDGRDTVELVKTSFDKISRGDIVLIRRRSGEYILHRVLEKRPDAFYIIGDAQQWIEGPLLPDQIIAAVFSVHRGKLSIACDNPFWKAFSLLWLRIIPIRHLLLGCVRVLMRFAYTARKHGKRTG